MNADLSRQMEQMAEQVTADFTRTLSQALARLLGEGVTAEQAMTDSAAFIDGGTLAWRLDPTTLIAELFCDIGLPEIAYTQDAYRLVLEANLNRSYPGAYIGVHSESDRLVVTSAMPAVLMTDESYCVTALSNLAAHARHLREQLAPYLQRVEESAQA